MVSFRWKEMARSLFRLCQLMRELQHCNTKAVQPRQQEQNFRQLFQGQDLIINNPNGVTLNAAKSIKTLTLTNGILITSGTNLLSVTNTIRLEAFPADRRLPL
jgi:hypothetical protein